MSIQPVSLVPPRVLPDAENIAERLTDGWTQPTTAACAPLDDAGTAAHFRTLEAVFGGDSLIIADFLEPIHPGILLRTWEYLASVQGLPEVDGPDPDEYAAREESPGRIPMRFAIRWWMTWPDI